MAHDNYANGINGELRVGDTVVTTYGARVEEYLVGTINEINEHGFIFVDFSKAKYSPFRVGEIEAAFDSYFGDKLHISERGLDNSRMRPQYAINTKVFTKDEMAEILQSKEQAAFHCKRVISEIQAEIEALKTVVKFYCPVSYEFCSEHGESKVTLTQEEAVQYENELSDAASDMIHMSEMDRGFMTYFEGPESIDEKVESVFFSMEAYEGKLWAVFTLKASEPLTDEELEFMRTDLAGYYNHDFEEYFDETEVAVEGGDIHVQIWKDGEGFFIETKEQLNQRLGLGLPDSMPEPPPRIATASDEKPSVMDCIRRHSQETRERPSIPKDAPVHKKSGQEL